MDDKKVTVIAKRLGGLNETFEYEAGSWKLLALEGVDAPTIELFHTAKGKGDGDIVTGSRLNSRLITVKARTTAGSNYPIQRNNCLRFHDVRAKYQLAITYLDKTVLTGPCQISAISYPTENVHKSPGLTVGFLAADPSFYSREEKKVNFAQVAPLWHVTRYYDGPQGKLPFGYTKASNNVEIEYNGSDFTGFTLAIRFTKQCQNLGVKINGELIKVFPDSQFTEGEKIIINSKEKTASRNNTRFEPKKLRKIPFEELRLAPGFNRIEIVEGSNVPVEAAIELAYRERFLSI